MCVDVLYIHICTFVVAAGPFMQFAVVGGRRWFAGMVGGLGWLSGGGDRGLIVVSGFWAGWEVLDELPKHHHSDRS